jgi:protein-tyrosine phosphatase
MDVVARSNAAPTADRCELTTYIDLHCHILPRIDDGPQTVDEALDMARFCVADGITHVVATPHCHRYVHRLRKDVLPAVAAFNERLQDAEIALTILPGSEIQVTDADEYRREFAHGDFCHLGDGRDFTLLEFNWKRSLFPAGAADLVRWIRDQGMTPILAHPERHDFFWEDPERLDRLVEAGAWVQVTVDSLLGNHGPSPSMAADELLRKHEHAVLATDAHNLARCSGLAAGYAWVREHLGDDRADDLLRRAERVRTMLGAAERTK